MQEPAGKGDGSTARAVRGWIETRPIVREALAQGLVNLSALARRIREETGVGTEEAILVACRRHQDAIRPRELDSAVRRVLSRSKLEVRTRTGILTVRPSWEVFARLEGVMRDAAARSQPLHVIQGSEALTVIGDESTLEQVTQALGPERVVKRRGGLVELNLRSPEVIEDVPGILSFLSATLSALGINFIDVISCHKDNMFLIDESDMFKAMEVLNGLTRSTDSAGK